MMEINKFKKLEKAIVEQDFNKSYDNINKVMFFLSIFGQIASIFLAYFLVSKVLSGVIPESPFMVAFISIVLLVGLELLKREVFDKFSFQFLKIKSLFNKDVLPLLVCSFLIITTSFYASINGAKEFSSKSKEIQVEADNNVSKYEDSLTNVYISKIQSIELSINNSKSKIDLKDDEQTKLESMQPLTTQQRARVRDLKDEREILRKEIISYQINIDTLKSELSNKIKEYEEKINVNADDKKNENSNNSIIFVFMSTIIELVILIGVYFNKYFKFRSYTEFKIKIDKDPNYQKWVLFDAILDIIYNVDMKLNDRFPSNRSIIDICKINGIILLPKDITEYTKLLNSLNITRTSGNQKYILKSKDSSKEILKQHFNIK